MSANPQLPEPTLLELLEHAARDYDHLENPMGPVVPYEPACKDMATRLRAASQRLREEMERAKLHPFVPGAVVVALNYINGGPLGTEGSDER